VPFGSSKHELSPGCGECASSGLTTFRDPSHSALDVRAADRDAYLRLAGDLEGFLARLRRSSATATTEDKQRT